MKNTLANLTNDRQTTTVVDVVTVEVTQPEGEAHLREDAFVTKGKEHLEWKSKGKMNRKEGLRIERKFIKEGTEVEDKSFRDVVTVGRWATSPKRAETMEDIGMRSVKVMSAAQLVKAEGERPAENAKFGSANEEPNASYSPAAGLFLSGPEPICRLESRVTDKETESEFVIRDIEATDARVEYEVMDWEIGPIVTPTERAKNDTWEYKTEPSDEEIICDEPTIRTRLGSCAMINLSPDMDELSERVTKPSNETLDELLGSHNQFRLMKEDRKPKTRNMRVTDQRTMPRILSLNDRSDLGKYMGMRSVMRRINKMKNGKSQRKLTRRSMVTTMKRRTESGVCEGTANRRRGKMWYSDGMRVITRGVWSRIT